MAPKHRLCYTGIVDRHNRFLPTPEEVIAMLEFIALNFPIVICFIIGVVLMVLEAFMPGFGIAGISGIVVEIIAVTLTWLNHGPVAALGMLLVILSVIAIAISMSLRSATNGRLSKSRIILRDTESNEAGYRSAEDMEVFLGRDGKAITVLRPTGIAEFDGVRLNVVSEGEFIAMGTAVRIVRIEGSRILVRPVAA